MGDKTKFALGAGLTVLGIVPLWILANIAGTAGGCVGGWLVGAIWPHTMATLLAKLGLAGVRMWQVGAMLGFVGGFFRSSPHVSKS